ncbi:hypothetical protein CBR_g46451 [Chara braunii]|uniref:Uncharacterized protein n=1 Tax=Chara braunii TaxID=69332 RepID=A0A388M0I0_CHABU|nr:hypothetical protein CBR_g46451 [Chara braunii]|eukprot:GBG88080.1 hypothetical protein CBR_g46451 [Chara braunii]
MLVFHKWEGKGKKKRKGRTPLQRANFTIHGLWPERFDGGWPSCCNVDEYPYEPEKIKDLQRQLDLDWPSLRCKPPSGCSNPGQGGIRSFHRHEVTYNFASTFLPRIERTVISAASGLKEKHGTCSIPVFPDIHRYFSAVLALKDSIDVLGALAKADIVPTDNERYTYQQMRDAIAVDVGATPHIDCKNGKLSEVWICLQKYPDSDNEFKVFDCPQSEVKSCPKGQPISIPVRTPFLDNGSQMTSAI